MFRTTGSRSHVEDRLNPRGARRHSDCCERERVDHVLIDQRVVHRYGCGSTDQQHQDPPPTAARRSANPPISASPTDSSPNMKPASTPECPASAADTSVRAQTQRCSKTRAWATLRWSNPSVQRCRHCRRRCGQRRTLREGLVEKGLEEQKSQTAAEGREDDGVWGAARSSCARSGGRKRDSEQSTVSPGAAGELRLAVSPKLVSGA